MITTVFWGTLAFVPVFTGGCLWWRKRLVRDEARRPFAVAPEPQPSVTRSLERPVVKGVVIESRETVR